MKLTSVTVSYGRTLNLGDFNSARLDIDLNAELEEGDDLHEVMTELWQTARANIKAQALPLVAKRQTQVEEAYLGLPKELQENLQ